MFEVDAFYNSFRRHYEMSNLFERRGLPSAYLLLLESLLSRTSKNRPSSEQVLRALREGKVGIANVLNHVPY